MLAGKGGYLVKVLIDIDKNYNENFVTIHVQEWSAEVEELVQQIKQTKPKRIVGIKEEQSILLEPFEIEYVFAEARKVFAVIHNQKVELKMKLYEVERLLEPYQFTRFSKSVVGNLNLISRFELAFNGNLCVIFKSGNKEYVTRKYVHVLKEKLIMGDSNDS